MDPEDDFGPGEVSVAAASGDERAMLVAVRDRLSLAIDSPKTSPRDLAALTRRLQEVSDRIRDFDAVAADQEAAAQAEAEEDDSFDPFDL